jgi:hypothetical protein
MIAGLWIWPSIVPSSSLLNKTQPQYYSPETNFTSLLIIDGSAFSSGLELSLRSLQALVNNVRPNQTGLYIVSSEQELFWLQNVYVNELNFNITYYPRSNNPVSDLFDLIELFRPWIRGYVVFDEDHKWLYPAILNFVSAYHPALLVPKQYQEEIIKDSEFWKLRDFTQISNQSSVNEIISVYKEQIATLDLSGVTLWNFQDPLAFTDWIISQKYWVFPSEMLTNSSFSSLISDIQKIQKSSFNKPILGNWPDDLSRLSVPSFPKISSVPNLSIHYSPFKSRSENSNPNKPFFELPLFQKQRLNLSDFSPSTVFYSIIVTFDSFSQNWYSLSEYLSVDVDIFEGVTFSFQDSLMTLFPYLLKWYLERGGISAIIPQIKVSNIIEPLYFPESIKNGSAIISSTRKFSDVHSQFEEWATEDYTSKISESLDGIVIPSSWGNETDIFELYQLENNFNVSLWEENELTQFERQFENDYLKSSINHLIIEIPFNFNLLDRLSMLRSVLTALGYYDLHLVSPDELISIAKMA